MNSSNYINTNEPTFESTENTGNEAFTDKSAVEIDNELTAERATIPQSAEETVDSDIAYLRESFSELSEIESISSLPNPTRYAALRDLGLTPEEAYLATGRIKKVNTKAHLSSSVPRAASAPIGAMSKQELSDARGIFCDMDDNEIQRLYKRVTN